MGDEAENTGARSAIILAIVVVLVAVFSVEFGLQTLVWGETRHWATSDPFLLEVPQPLHQPAEQPKGTEVRAYGFEFIAPWPGNITPVPSVTNTAFRFASGHVVVFFDPETTVDTLRELQSSNQAQYIAFANVFAGKPFDTNYALFKAIYEASPAQTSPFADRGDALRLNQLLLWKLSFGVDAPGSMSSFDFGKNRGFQFGDPAQRLPVAIRVFTDRDQQFRLVFVAADGSSAKITQDDINCVIQSLQRIPFNVH